MPHGLTPKPAVRYPFVAKVITTFPNARTIGSAALIGPRLLLTAGHVVFDAHRGGQASHFLVTLGGSVRRSWEATDWRTTTQWRDEDSLKNPRERSVSTADVGVIVLPEPIDMHVSPVQVQTAPAEALRQMLLNVVGYRSSDAIAADVVYHGVFRSSSVGKHRLIYPLRTVGGQSGGPVYHLQDGARTVHAIHTSIVASQGSALRMNGRVFRLIERWQRAFHPVRTDATAANAA